MDVMSRKNQLEMLQPRALAPYGYSYEIVL
jgi:hypothetical protein